MKRSLSIILLLLFSFQFLYSQVADSTTIQSQQELYDYYMLKSKKQKTTGLILAGIGFASVIGGFGLASTRSTSQQAGFGFVLIGSVATIISVPILLSSGSNKRKTLEYVDYDDPVKLNQELNEYYQKRHKKRKIVGWTLLGTGISTIIIGEASQEVVISNLGIAVTIASIPVLISSGSNKRKARAFITTGDFRDPIKNSRYASVGISFDF